MREQNNINIGVHKNHCCKEHGCKYMDDNCPVVLGTVIQNRPCIDCDEVMQKHLHSTPRTIKFEQPKREEEHLETVKFGDPSLDEKTSELLRKQNTAEVPLRCNNECQYCTASIKDNFISFNCTKYNVVVNHNSACSGPYLENRKDPSSSTMEVKEQLIMEFYKSTNSIPTILELDSFVLNKDTIDLKLSSTNKLHSIIELLKELVGGSVLRFSRLAIKTKDSSSTILLRISSLISSKVEKDDNTIYDISLQYLV